MTPVLVTERLVLRGIVADDAADLFAFRSDPVEHGYHDIALFVRLARERLPAG